MPSTSGIYRVLGNRLLLVLAALFAVAAASWIYLLAGAGTGMSTFAMTSWQMAIGSERALSRAVATPVDWTGSYAFTMFIMWWVMMIAMMLPSAAPIILLHAKIRGAEGHTLASYNFVAGYLLAWGSFSVAAVSLQWLFEKSGLLSPYMMNTSSNLFAAAILLFAGAYQLSPLKRSCLRHCQGPLGFLTHHWKSGKWGAVRMGFHHGIFCLGCCAGLMAILFFGGIMNLYWIAGLALLVLAEKLLPLQAKIPWLSGTVFVVWGLSFLWRAVDSSG